MVKLTTPEIVELQKLCHRSFPSRLDQRVSQFSFRQDDRYRLLSMALSWTESRRPRVERLIVRGYVTRWTWWRLDDDAPAGAKAQREWQVMRWLYGQGWPVPRVYATGDDYLLTEATWQSAGTLQNGRAEIEPYIQPLARLLAQLHRLSPPGAVRETLPSVAVDAELARLKAIAAQCGDDGLKKALSELSILFAKPDVEAYPPCVLCGEAVFARARFDARGVTLPSWENCAYGDPRWDLGSAVNWLRAHDAAALIDRFLDAYLACNMNTRDDLDIWLALSGAQRWALTSWLREQDANCPLVAGRSTWLELTWRALTRLRRP